MVRLRILLMISVMMVAPRGYTQDIKGIYTLGYRNEVYYVNFKNNSFQLFSLQENPAPGRKTIQVIKEVGSGLFKQSNKSISLHFDNNTWKHRFFSSDSLVSYMNTKASDQQVGFEITMKANVPEYDNTYLLVEGYSREYWLQVKNGSVKTALPDSIAVKNVYVSIMGYGKRALPFSQYYNNFKYDYFLNDISPQINFIQRESWVLPVKYHKRNDYFRLDHTEYLAKADDKRIRFLKALAANNLPVKTLTDEWFE